MPVSVHTSEPNIADIQQQKMIKHVYKKNHIIK